MTLACVVPMRCTAEDIFLAEHLLRSIARTEGEKNLVLILYDGNLPGEAKDRLCSVYSELKFLRNPRLGIGYGRNGGLACGLLSAFSVLMEMESPPDCVLKIDVDALVLRPFATQIAETIALYPRGGVFGTLGATPRRSWGRYYSDLKERSPFVSLDSIIAPYRDELYRQAGLTCNCDSNMAECFPKHLECLVGACNTEDDTDLVERDGDLEEITLEVMAYLSPLIRRAVEHGFTSKLYCAGGAYILTSSFLQRLRQSGLLSCSLFWRYMPYGEDQIIGLLAYAHGVDLIDCSSPGDVFAVQVRGLAFDLPTLMRLQYAIIHSTRGQGQDTPC